MGDYLNPGNEKFHNYVNDDIYVDKTGLIAYTNDRISKSGKFMCVTRPRRFGKSYAADMLTAYYSRGCDSRAMFDGREISKSPSYETHLNKYNVIYVDFSSYIKSCPRTFSVTDILDRFFAKLTSEIRDENPDIVPGENDSFSDFLAAVHKKTDIPFIFVIDEWDAFFRNRKDDVAGQKEFMDSLEAILKGKPYVALAYMTGILPIKKYCTGSALNMFDEFTMLRPGPIKEYIGFTEKEVENLCAGSKFTAKDMKDWYDGYSLGGLEIYNPNSVVCALRYGELSNYWSGTEAYEDLLSYIKVNVDGLHAALRAIFANEKYVLDVQTTFPNDLVNLKYKEDYIIALIHLGYLSYNSEDKTVTIPNHEVRIQFEDTVSKMGPSVVTTYYEYTQKLLDATLSACAEDVACLIGKIFAKFTRRTGYENEDDFGNFIYSSYIAAEDYYDVVREASTRWLKRADYLFYPNLMKARAGRTYLPGVIIELKNNKSAEEAADQIEEKGYDDYFEYRGYHGDVIHVGLDFKKMAAEKRLKLAKESSSEKEPHDKTCFYGNDARLDTRAEIVHFCEIRKYRI
ncbi:MAG: ATP-binding protein [Clostridia bacterium]|nr:ATP-binding protein [Clostridia bacterium]